ncbi:DUF1538 family protein [Aerococcaceae bacterium INB8]|uniref:DUF1538 family protein n=1 Tax=Ruoffia halotolerans TaxID=2748684 RepID=A0A839A455_9LACT|nr:DUF1538 family protein [Ruoffia halotolerans]MBA5728558.1 DUF1538 family protein [Ruoffia halotolerans]
MIVFDSGEVAARTMTATFILPFTQGLVNFVPKTDSITEGFDVIVIVSLMLNVIVQLVGIFYNYQVKQ